MAAGNIFDWKPFQVNKSFKPGSTSGFQLEKLVNENDFPNAYSREFYEPITNRPAPVNVSAEKLWHLRVSRLAIDPLRKDLKEEEREEQLTREILNTMPSMVTDWKGRESLEMMGQFFEPTVNLEIRF
jgi:CRISPR/Cas system CSM-associated protein Csm2 small subunit